MTDHEAQLYEILINNHIGFGGNWSGWRMAGEFLISPDGLRLRNPQLRVLFCVHGNSPGRKRRKVIHEQMELFER